MYSDQAKVSNVYSRKLIESEEEGEGDVHLYSTLIVDKGL